MNNNKIFNIIFLLFVLLGNKWLLSQSFAFEALEYDKVQQLQEVIDQFEINFYQTGIMDSAQLTAYSEACTNLIDSYLAFSRQIEDTQFAEMAFAYLEKLKSQRLLKLFIPAVTSKSSQRTLLHHLESNRILSRRYFRLQNELLFKKGAKDSLLQAIQSTLDSMNSLWLSVLSDEPPLSFFLLQQKPITPTCLQTNCLKENEAILDFWVSKNRINIFIVSLDTFVVVELQTSLEKIKRHVNKLTNLLFQNKDILKLEFDYELSNVLFMELFQPVVAYFKHIKTITILPDGFLTSFPFEILISNIHQPRQLNKEILYQNYREYDFIIHKYAFCYNYTAMALCPEAEKLRSRTNLGRKLLTMSEPAVDQNASIPFSDIDILSLADLNESSYSTNEIKRVGRLLWYHRNLKGSEVTKQYLTKSGWKYRWFYLSQPGILNNKHPLNSGLLFSKSGKDSTLFSNWLSCSDVLNCFLRADMITLSSCHTIPYSIDQNDGMIALPMSFLFAGIRSVVHSQWNINSISTSQFMSKFYWELKYKRQTNASALREAKVSSMKDTFRIEGMEISRAHPFFWAGFRLIGDQRVIPPTKNIIPPWGVVIIIYVILISGIFLITRKTASMRFKQVRSH